MVQSHVFRSFVLASIVLLFAFICTPAPAAASDVLVLRLGHVVVEEGAEHLGAMKLAEVLQKKSGGKIKLEIYPNGQLGQNREMIESLQAGALDMSLPALPNLGGFSQAGKPLDLLFLFKTHQEAEKVLDSSIGRDIAKAMEPSGFKVLSWWSQGFREVTSNREFRKPGDLKGLKLRVQDTPVQIEAWNAVGASAIPMAFSEVLTSLQQGVLDAQETTYQNILLSGFDKVQKYLIETDHVYGPVPLVISMKVWNKLTPQQQKMVADAAEEVKSYQRGIAEKVNNDCRDALIKENKIKYIKFTPAEKEAFRKAALPYYKKIAPSLNGMLERIYKELGRPVDFK